MNKNNFFFYVNVKYLKSIPLNIIKTTFVIKHCTVPSQTQPSKQCAYRNRLVPGHHQYRPSRQVAGRDRLLQ